MACRMKWMATMPKDAPTDAQKDQVVFAHRGFGGRRMEFTGNLLRADAERVMALVIELSKNAKLAPQAPAGEQK